MSRNFRAACVMGWPVKHSRSPLIHGHWIKQHGIDGAYRIEEVESVNFADFLASLAARGYVGGNVTMPHKQAALTLSEPDERARGVGAANTLWLDGGKLRSTNTDIEGFIANLDASAPGWDKDTKVAVVLGAGGAGQAIVYGLIERGVGRIHVVNRTVERAEAFKRQFGPRVSAAHWADLPRLLGAADLLVNTTPLGMHGQADLVIDLSSLPDNAVVADIVYVPLETPLLALARGRRLRTVDGLGMLLHQAVRGFSLWFGVRPDVTADLRELVIRDLIKH